MHIPVNNRAKTPAQAPVMDTNKKHSLGQRAFIVFLFRRIKFAVLLFIIAFAAWYGERWIPAGSTYAPWGDYAAKMVLLVAVGYFLFAGEQHGFRRATNIKRCLDAELTFYAVEVFRIGLTF